MPDFTHGIEPYAVRILLAVAVGSAIGWQRQMHGSPAGLRTHILVCIASTLLSTLDMAHGTFQGKIDAAIITGVGFLGAGTIIHSDKGDSVRGLTTAASVWSTAGIGIALGCGGASTWLGVFVAFLVLATLSIVFQIEDFALRNRRTRKLTAVLNRPSGESSEAIVSRLIGKLTDSGAAVEGIKKELQTDNSNELIIHCQIRLPDGFQPDKVLQICNNAPDVVEVTWDV